ncbi:MAG: sugar phosphate isomerase/epimerase [Bacteroidota bacterium]
MKRTLLTALSLALVSTAFSQGLYKAPFGIQTYSFRNSFPKGVAQTLDTIKSFGITELEANAPGTMTNEEFKKLCDERGLKIPSTGAGYDDLTKDPMKIVTQAKVLGATYVMTAWIPHERGKFTLENAKKAVADFNSGGKVLAENGLTFCYHIHGFEFQPYEDGTLLDYIIKNTDPKYVSFEMDILWTYFGGGDPVKLLKKYGKRFKLLHVKDLKKGTPKDLTGGTDTNNDVTLGTGEIDIPAIIRQANKLGIKHFFIEDESSRVTQQVPQSIAYLKSLKK